MAKNKNEVLLEFAGDAGKLEREARQATAAVDGFGDKVRKVSGDVDRHLKGMGDGFSKLGGIAKTGGLAIGTALGAGVAAGLAAALVVAKAGFDAFIESETARFRQEFQFNQAGLGAFISDFQDFNSELMKSIPFDDDALAQAQGILARAFGTPEEIRRYTLLAADLSAVTGRDIASSAEAIVKAAAGSTRILKDFGIDLGGLADEGENAADIFALLEQKVGGAAYELGSRAPGQLEIAKNRFGEIEEAIGGALTPTILDALNLIGDLAEKIMGGWASVGEAFEDLGIDTSGLKDAFGDLKDAYEGGLDDAFAELRDWVSENKEEIQDFIDDLARLVEVSIPLVLLGLDAATKFFETFAGMVMFAVDQLRDFVDWIERASRAVGLEEPLTGVAAGQGNAAAGSKRKKHHAGSGGFLPGAPGQEVPFIGLAGERVVSRGESGRNVLEIRSSGSRLDDFIVEMLARAADRAGGNLQLAVTRR